MKGKIIFSVILSAILLTGCNSSGTENTDNPADVPSAEQETLTEISPETTLETEAEETKTTPEVTVVTEETAEAVAKISGTTSSEYFDYFTFDLEKYEEDIKDHPLLLMKPDFHQNCTLLSKNLLCSFYQYQKSDNECLRYLRFYDIDKDEITAEIPLPENYYFFSYSHEKNDDDNVLVKAYLMNDLGTGPDGFGEITVYKDYSYDSVTEYGAVPYPGVDYFNTGIYANDPDTNIIENLRTNTTIVDAPNGIALYGSSIDENRFTFKHLEYEVGSYIGIYDYSTGNIIEIPDSDNLDPVGYYDGKIYACESNSASHHVEDGIGTVYSFDVESFEKKVFMTFHTPDDNTEGNIACHMTQDCGYMSVVLSSGTSAETAYIVSLDSGEILAKHETDAETNDGELREILYADGRVALVSFFTDKLLVLDPKE